jgi:predicted ATP-grasp superfamily ATP-dependent carboligase
MSGILKSSGSLRVMTGLPALDAKRPVLILTANRDAIHHGAVAIARSLGRLGIPVYAIVQDGYTPLVASRYVTKCFVWKGWPGDREALLVAMSRIAEMINDPPILVALDDLSAVSIAENASALSRWFLFPQLPSTLPRQLANKASLYSLCGKIGVPCAPSIVPRRMDDVREFIEHTTFPIVAKATEQWKLLKSRYNVKIIQARDALFEICEHIDSDENPSLLLQEYVPGEDWIYHGYCDPEAGLYLSFTGKKLLDYPPGAGSTAVGLSCLNEVVYSHSERLLRSLSYSGISDMDWRRDQRDGQYKLMDCNPRVGMNFRMFENSTGIDVVRAQHLSLTGRHIDCTKMIDGRLFVVEPYCALSLIRSGRWPWTIDAGTRLTTASTELAWWSSDDKLPFFAMIMRTLPRVTYNAVHMMWNFAASGRLVRWVRRRMGQQDHPGASRHNRARGG